MERNHPIVTIRGSELEQCRVRAKAAWLNGKSNVRANSQEREDAGMEDQLVGQVATLAGCKHLFGYRLGHYLYSLGRWAADRNPRQGDEGEDVPGSNIDFKGSLIRTDNPLDSHRLAVRPRELHKGWVYILCLVAPTYEHVHLMGWQVMEALPGVPETSGVFAGAHVLPVAALHEVPPFAWSF